MTFLRYKYTGNVILIVWCSFSRKSQVIRKKKSTYQDIIDTIRNQNCLWLFGDRKCLFLYIKCIFIHQGSVFSSFFLAFFQIFSIFLFIFISKRHNPWGILFFIFSPVFLFLGGFSLFFFILQAKLHIFCFLSIYLISL
mgnify:CR=1 FL=1